MTSIETKIVDIIHDKGTKYEKLSDILALLVKTAKIDQKKYMIIGSYSIRKHREISDLDMNMETNEWDKLSKLADKGLGKVEYYNNQMRYFLDMTNEYKKVDPEAKDFSIEVFQKGMHEGYPNNDFSMEALIKSKGLSKDSNKHPFFSTKTLLAWKKTMNREKDKKDIELLETLVKRNRRTKRAGMRLRKTEKRIQFG
jgi:hypothetical protein